MATQSPCPPRPLDLSGRMPVRYVAAGVLVDRDGRLLLAQRPEGKAMAGLWEFPGGKIEAGEIPEAALRRELMEELGIDVCVSCMLPFTFASHSYDGFHLVMPTFLIRNWDGVPRPIEAAALKWVRLANIAEYSLPAADEPIVSMLRDCL